MSVAQKVKFDVVPAPSRLDREPTTRWVELVDELLRLFARGKEEMIRLPKAENNASTVRSGVEGELVRRGVSREYAYTYRQPKSDQAHFYCALIKGAIPESRYQTLGRRRRKESTQAALLPINGGGTEGPSLKAVVEAVVEQLSRRERT